MTDGPSPVEPASADRLAIGERAVRFIDDFLERREAAPAWTPPPPRGVLEDLQRPPGEEGAELDDLLEVLESVTADGIDTAAGSHLSYIPNGGIYAGAVGEYLAAAINRYTGGVHGAPAAIALEQGIVRWILSLFRMEGAGAGILLSGGSLANFTAMVAARERFGLDFGQGTVYTSERSHHSVRKAARLAGIAPSRIREVPADRSLRVDLAALDAAIDADRAAGLRPLAIVGSAGTTDTGTIDPLPQLSAAAERFGAWFHVDAAYGGFFQLTERGAARLSGIELADSITLDAHKSLFLPYGTGCLIVADRQTLVDAHQDKGSYMQDVPELAGLPSYFALGPELTRPYRGLPVWLALHLHGVAAFRTELDRMLDLAEQAQAGLREIGRVEAVTEPDLSVVAFRSTRDNDDARHLLDHINRSGRVHVSSTTIADDFVLRLAFLNPRTTGRHVDAALDLLRTAP